MEVFSLSVTCLKPDQTALERCLHINSSCSNSCLKTLSTTASPSLGYLLSLPCAELKPTLASSAVKNVEYVQTSVCSRAED